MHSIVESSVSFSKKECIARATLLSRTHAETIVNKSLWMGGKQVELHELRQWRGRDHDLEDYTSFQENKKGGITGFWKTKKYQWWEFCGLNDEE